MVRIGPVELGEFPLLLAPMEDVSDPPFRALCKEHGADMMYTEFISSEGLIRDAAKSRQKLDIYEKERPIGIQIFGSEIESMRRAAEISAASGRMSGHQLRLPSQEGRLQRGWSRHSSGHPQNGLHDQGNCGRGRPSGHGENPTWLGRQHQIHRRGGPNAYKTWAFRPSPFTAGHVHRCTKAKPTGV